MFRQDGTNYYREAKYNRHARFDSADCYSILELIFIAQAVIMDGRSVPWP
jgi:hypothetical protein